MYGISDRIRVEINETTKELFEIVKERVVSIYEDFKNKENMYSEISIETDLINYTFDSYDYREVDGKEIKSMEQVINTLDNSKWFKMSTSSDDLEDSERVDRITDYLLTCDESVFDYAEYSQYFDYDTGEVGNIYSYKKLNGEIYRGNVPEGEVVTELEEGMWYSNDCILYLEKEEVTDKVQELLNELEQYVERDCTSSDSDTDESDEFIYHGDKIIDNKNIQNMFDIMLKIHMEISPNNEITTEFVNLKKNRLEMLRVIFDITNNKYIMVLFRA